MRIASIISDTKKRREWSYKIISLRRKLSLLLYGGGIIWLLLLPVDELNGQIYIDENALMPRYAADMYDGDQKVMQLAGQLNQVSWDQLPHWISSKFSAMGMEVFTQNFTVSLPVMLDHQSASIIEGLNVYAVQRAAKTSSSEAIVLAVMVEEGNLFSLAMLTGLAEYLSTKPYWAKDLIFVVTNGGKYGMQAWLESYLGIESASIHKEYVVSRSGIIQAAMILDVTSPAIQHVSLLTNGINGQLSNQDIANTAIRLLRAERIPPSFHGQVDASFNDRYFGGLKTMLRGISHQATGLPEHLHGLFVRYHIDALTFKAYSNPVKMRGSKQLQAFGRAVEGTLRSINNLLEPLHHSFFFYLPVSSYRYVSISIYFPPLGCVFIALVLEGLVQWLLARDPQLRTKTEAPASADVAYEPVPLASVLPIGLTAVACGYLVYVSPVIYSNLIGPITPNILLCCVITTVVISMVTVPFIRLVSATDWHMVKFFYILLLLISLLAISLLNFSLSLIISVGITLPCLFAAPIGSNGLDKYCLARILFTLLLSPPLLFLYYTILYVYMFEGHTELPAIISRSIDLTSDGVTELYLSSQVLGSWVYVTVSTCVWPLWLAILSINFQ